MLIAELRKGNFGSRSWYAAEALGEIGKAALPAIPDLEVAAQSKQKHLSRYAKEAIEKLQQIKKQQHVPSPEQKVAIEE